MRDGPLGTVAETAPFLQVEGPLSSSFGILHGNKFHHASANGQLLFLPTASADSATEELEVLNARRKLGGRRREVVDFVSKY